MNTNQNFTYKVLKITLPNGVSQIIPDNAKNRKFHVTKKSSVSREKQARYFIEPQELSLDEAAELGIYEAYARKNPPKVVEQKSQTQILMELIKQNQVLIEQLTKSKPKNGKNENNSPE